MGPLSRLETAVRAQTAPNIGKPVAQPVSPGILSDMINTDEIRSLPVQEKLQMMETLWESLSQDPDLPSPDWHGAALAETAERYAAGKEESVDWETAKKRLRSE